MKIWLHRRLRGMGLSRRITLVVTILAMVTAIAAAALTTRVLDEHNRAETDRLARSYAQSIASAAKSALGISNPAHLETMISEFARLPSIESVELVDMEGTGTLRISQDKSGLHAEHTPFVRTPPSAGARHLTRLETERALVVWQPVDDSSAHGWVMLRMSLADEDASHAEILLFAFVGALNVAGVTIGAVFLSLRRALDPLETAAQFARDLDQRIGEQLALHTTSLEVQTLVDALNSASRSLRFQFEELSRRDAELRAIVDTAADAVIGLDDTGCVRLFNSAATSMFGPESNQIVGRPVAQLIPSLTFDELRQQLAHGTHVGSKILTIARGERIGLRNAENEFPIEVAISEVADSQILRYTVIVRDITEQRMANEHLQIYMRALECSSNGMVIQDARFPGHPVLWVNSAFTRITGYALDEIVGNSCRILERDDQDQPEIARMLDAVREVQHCTVTLRNYRKDGSLFWNQVSIAPVLDESHRVTHFVSALTDITERMNAARAIERRKEQLDLIMELSPDGFALFDRHGYFVYANAAFTRMCGISPSELDSSLRRERLDELVRRNADPHLPWPVPWAEDATAPRRIVLISPERRILACEAKHGAESGDYVLFVRDVTQETEVERMKSEFLSTAAHELRTPLVSIFGFSELLMTRKFDAQRAEKMVGTIHRQSGLIVNLINELLDLARIEARQGKDFRIVEQTLQPLIQDAVASILVPGDARKVDVELPSEPILLPLDAEKFRQALVNVLSNAYKYSPRGGAIQLDLQFGERRGLSMVGVRVTDHGIGMNPAQSARAFERFYRADPSGNIPGTGLGLSIVKEIIELHGGEVELVSEAGIGTQVWLWMPRRDAVARKTASSQQIEHASA